MRNQSDSPRLVRAGAFDIDLGTGEVRRDTQRVALEDQPFQLLGLLVQRAGKVVPREEILKKLWPAESLVDPERSLDIALQRLRQALGDTAAKPEYIETIPGRGYRFVAKVSAGPPGPIPGSDMGRVA